jgi:hypothetical protein
LFTDWADASSPPHLLTGASTVCYRGGQSDELSGSQLSTLPSSTTLFAAPDRNLTKSQNSKVEINKSSLPPLFPPFPKPDQALPPQSFITTQHPLLVLILHCTLPCPFFLSQLVLPLQPPVAPPQEPKTKKKISLQNTTTTTNSFFVSLSVYYTKSSRVSELLVGFLLLLLLQRVMIV